MRHTPARLLRSRLDGRRAAAAFPVARSFYGSVPSGYFALSLSLRGVAWRGVALGPPPYHKSGEESRVYYTRGVGVKNGLFIRRHKRDRRERAPKQKEMFAICDCDGRVGGEGREA